MAFSTLSVGQNQITSATLQVHFTGDGDHDIMVVEATAPSTTTNISAADFKAISGYNNGGSMSGNTTDYISTPVAPTNGWNAISLNANAIEAFNSGQEFRIALVDYIYDYQYLPPPLNSLIYTGIIISGNLEPYLVVETGTPGLGQYVLSISPESYSNVNSVPQGNIKLVNRLEVPAGYQTTWNTVLVGPAWAQPYGIVLDSLGNCYFSYYSTGIISKITPSGTVSTFATTGQNNYGGITIDSSNNIYVCGGIGLVQKITPDGVVTTFGTTGTAPYRLVLDTSGNVYVTNYISGSVSKITPAGNSTIFASTGAGPYGITIDSSGNLYTCNSNANNISKITPDGFSTIFATTAPGESPTGITIDSSGNLYTCNAYTDNVSKITPDGTSSILGTTGRSPEDIVLDSNNNVYVTNSMDGTVTKITQAGVSSIFGYVGYIPHGIEIDTSGNIYVANQSLGIMKLTLSDVVAPTAPTALTVNSVSQTSVNLTWSLSTDNVELRHYLIYVNGTLFKVVYSVPPYLSFPVNVSDLTASTNYSFTVYARDARGNVSSASNTVNATTTDDVS
jgi:streptogramin lyase